jgi:hypothetical protein
MPVCWISGVGGVGLWNVWEPKVPGQGSTRIWRLSKLTGCPGFREVKLTPIAFHLEIRPSI